MTSEEASSRRAAFGGSRVFGSNSAPFNRSTTCALDQIPTKFRIMLSFAQSPRSQAPPLA